MQINICNDQKDTSNLTIKTLDKTLEMVKVYKYLGIFIDTQLNFQHHNRVFTRNVNLKVTHFKRIRKFVTRGATEMIYKCTILPVLEYADFILDQGFAYIKKALQKIQILCLLVVNNGRLFEIR